MSHQHAELATAIASIEQRNEEINQSLHRCTELAKTINANLDKETQDHE